MTWSHMTTAQAVALRELLTQLGTAGLRQYWSRSQTRDDDHTCTVIDPTEAEITAIAALMKLAPQEDTP
jgi:N-acyl-D-aspartate/D-glutamate deacylase